MRKEKHQNLQQLDGTSCADCSLQWKMHISHILPPDPCESPTEVLMVKPGVMKWSSHQMRWREYASQGGERSWFWPFYWCASSGLCVCVRSCWSEVPEWWTECLLLQTVQPSDAFVIAHVPNLWMKRCTEKEMLLCFFMATSIQVCSIGIKPENY